MEAFYNKTPKFLNIKRTAYSLILLCVITFLTGFLQDTEFGFITYIFYFILLLVGVKLIFMTLKSETSRVLKAFLLVMGFSSALFFLWFLIAIVISSLNDDSLIEVLEELEGLFYLVSLAFLIGSMGSLVLFKMVNDRWRN